MANCAKPFGSHDNQQSGPQVDASGKNLEFDITPEMIAAGVDALSLWEPSEDASQVVWSVYRAMASAARLDELMPMKATPQSKPFPGLRGHTAFNYTDAGDTLVYQDDKLGLCSVDLSKRPSEQVAVQARRLHGQAKRIQA